MQTFSNMRRSGAYKQTLLALALFLALCVYESAAGMLLWLPPLIGVCLSLFMRFDKEDNFYGFLAILAGMALIEAENGLPMGMILGLFLVLYVLIIPRIQAVLNTPRIARATYVSLAYVGFYLLSCVLDSMLGSNITPSVWIMLYYMIIEILVAMFI